MHIGRSFFDLKYFKIPNNVLLRSSYCKNKIFTIGHKYFQKLISINLVITTKLICQIFFELITFGLNPRQDKILIGTIFYV